MKPFTILIFFFLFSGCAQLSELQPVEPEKSQIDKHEEALAQHAQVIDMLVEYITKLQDRGILPTGKSLTETEGQ